MSRRIFVIPPSVMLTDHLPHGDGLVAWGFIEQVGARGHELHVAAGGLDLRREPPQNVHLHHLGEPTSRMRYMRHVRRLYRQLGAFDLVHQLNPVDVGVSLALAGHEAPLVLGPYVPDWAPSGAGADAPQSRSVRQAKRMVRAAQQRRATAVLLSTAAARSKLSGPGRPRVYELGGGIDPAAWHPSADSGGGQDVLFLANLEVRKGIHVLLDAFARLAPELPEARLLIAGEGPEADSVRRRASELQRVQLLGQLDRDRVMAAMQACDVYCLPSYGEPYGMTALEAMACARPVIATAAGGLQHLVPDDGGRKVAPGDPGALAGALRELLLDPGLRHAMGQRNRALIEQRYAWSRVGDRLEQIYEETLNDAR